MIAVALVVMVVLLAAAIHAGLSAGASKRSGVLQAVAQELGGTSSGHGLFATVEGVAVSLDYETRGSGSSTESWTYLDAALPGRYPLVLNVDRHGWFDRGKIERGEMVDVLVGDQAFDDAFRIEGAPAEVVKHMLTPELRAYLRGHAHVEVRTLEGPKLRIAVRTWLSDRDAIHTGLQMVARLAASLRPVTLALDAQIPTITTGDAYRAMTSDQPLRDARAARVVEVARVESVRQRRRGHEMAIVLGLFAIVIAGAVLGIAAIVID